jgi:peptide/nickel transport system ATP-binding protein
MGTQPLLSIQDLWVEYRSNTDVVKAVNGIRFDVMPGETIGLVGETGAGKTTTALSILRLLPSRTGFITQGKVLYKGESLLDKSENEMRKVRGAEISMIFQDPMTALNPIITVGDQIAESLEIHNEQHLSGPEREKRAEELLEMVGIPANRKNNYPHEFSGGMKQRVVIAISLACNPELLIADEPTTALDVTIQAQVLAMMNELKERLGTSMIMITHDLGIVAETCDKVAIMYAGEIVEQGTVEDIFLGDHHHPYTTGLFGSIPNLEVKSQRLSPIEGLMPDPVDLPSGCKFHPRCKQCMSRCVNEIPCILGNGTHKIACHLFEGEVL